MSEEEKQQGADPKMELFQRGFYNFMGDVTMETMSPLIDWIIASNFSKEKKHKELKNSKLQQRINVMSIVS